MSQGLAHGVTDAQLVTVVLQSDPILNHVQRELRRLLPDLTVERLRQILQDEIVRQEILSAPQLPEARDLVQRVNSLRARGFTTTQTMRAVVAPDEDGTEGHEDANDVLREDRRQSGSGG